MSSGNFISPVTEVSSVTGMKKDSSLGINSNDDGTQTVITLLRGLIDRLGNSNDIATAEDLSDITTTTTMGKIRRSLLTIKAIDELTKVNGDGDLVSIKDKVDNIPANIAPANEYDTEMARIDQSLSATESNINNGLVNLNDISTADVKTQADQALDDYDAPTKTEVGNEHVATQNIINDKSVMNIVKEIESEDIDTTEMSLTAGANDRLSIDRIILETDDDWQNAQSSIYIEKYDRSGSAFGATMVAFIDPNQLYGSGTYDTDNQGQMAIPTSGFYKGLINDGETIKLRGATSGDQADDGRMRITIIFSIIDDGANISSA